MSCGDFPRLVDLQQVSGSKTPLIEARYWTSAGTIYHQQRWYAQMCNQVHDIVLFTLTHSTVHMYNTIVEYVDFKHTHTHTRTNIYNMYIHIYIYMHMYMYIYYIINPFDIWLHRRFHPHRQVDFQCSKPTWAAACDWTDLGWEILGLQLRCQKKWEVTNQNGI